MKNLSINPKTGTIDLINEDGIIVFYGDQPVLEAKFEEAQQAYFGVNRDRDPDNGWSEFRNSRMDQEYCTRVPLTPELKKILIEDICEYYKGRKAYIKLMEFGLIS